MRAKRSLSWKDVQLAAKVVNQDGDAHIDAGVVELRRRAALLKSHAVWSGGVSMSRSWYRNFAEDKVFLRTLAEYPCWIMVLLWKK